MRGVVRATTPPLERVWAKVQTGQPDECWLWQGRKPTSNSRPSVNLGGRGSRRVIAARLVLAEKLGRDLAPGAQACHTCDHPLCLNPAHLFEGTNADNVADMVAKGRQNRGERNGRVRLTAEDVEKIRADPRSSRLVAADYGVSDSHVRSIRRGRFWKSGGP